MALVKTVWYMLTGSRYLWRVWPVRFIARPRLYRLGWLNLKFIWATGYLPYIRVIGAQP